MCRLRRGTISILIASWTIVQAIFHLGWIGYYYSTLICDSEVNGIISSLFYLTYFYQRKCEYFQYKENNVEKHFAYENGFLDLTISNDDKYLLIDLLDDIINKNGLPQRSHAFDKSVLYMKILCGIDSVWLISAVSLLMATIFRIKGRWCFMFATPWLASTLTVLIFDILMTCHFAFDISKTQGVENWFNFVGITNVDPKAYKSIPEIYLTFPAIVISAFSSRFIIFWILNWLAFFYVLKTTIKNCKFCVNQPTSRPRRVNESSIAGDLTLDTSAARIRTWQQFYGAIESSSSRSSIEQCQTNDELKNNNQNGVMDGSDVLPKDVSNKTSAYRPYLNVDYSDAINNELRKELPWSYIQSNEVTKRNKRIHESSGESSKQTNNDSNQEEATTALPNIKESNTVLKEYDGFIQNELRKDLPWSYIPSNNITLQELKNSETNEESLPESINARKNYDKNRISFNSKSDKTFVKKT